jgi:hypothetical protein
MSKPSKPCFFRNWTVVVANSLLLASVATILVKGADPMFHPPTAKRVFRAGFCCFRPLNLAYLKDNYVDEEIYTRRKTGKLDIHYECTLNLASLTLFTLFHRTY